QAAAPKHSLFRQLATLRPRANPSGHRLKCRSNPSADELQPSVKYRRDFLFYEGELITLKGPDIDFKGGFIHVQRNLSRGKISVTKNGKDRKVDMSTQLANTLDELLSRRRAEALCEEMKKPAQERRDTARGSMT